MDSPSKRLRRLVDFFPPLCPVKFFSRERPGSGAARFSTGPLLWPFSDPPSIVGFSKGFFTQTASSLAILRGF